MGSACGSTVKTFAAKYAGREREIEFDGSVSALLPNDDDTYDVGLEADDKGDNTAFEHTFQFQDASDADLSPAGSNALEVGTKLHIVAGVGDFNAENCLFQLTPVSTTVR